MDQFIGYIFDKLNWKNIIVLFFFLEIPSLILIFVWNKDIFLMTDMIKLILFSFAIGFMLFIPNYFCVKYIAMLEDKDGTQEERDENYTLAIGMTFITISIAIVYKLCDATFTIINFIAYDALFLIVIAIFNTVKVARKSIKSKKKIDENQESEF